MSSVLEAFRRAAPPPFRALPDAELATIVEPALARGGAAWPEAALAGEVFAAFVAARLPDDLAPADALEAAELGDLYLACACLQAVPAAIAAFERTFAQDLGFALGRFRLEPDERDDIAQELRESFFVKQSLAKYSGRGKLRAWVRTVAMRAGLDHVDARKPRADDDGARVLENLRATGDAEIDVIRHNFRVEFETAFRTALGSLSGHERTLLLQHYVDDLSIDQLAAHHGTHRSTTARWMVDLRARLLVRVRAALQQQLHITRPELESLMGLAQSQLHISLFRLLKTP